MAEKLHDLSHKLTSNVSSAYHGVHGAGEAFRGTVNITLDGLVPNHESREGGGRARNEAVAQKGLAELHGAEDHFGVNAQQGHASEGQGLGRSVVGAEGAGVAHQQQQQQQPPPPPPRHHEGAGTGAGAGARQGGFLGKGTMRGDRTAGQQEAVQERRNPGLGAAKQAWAGQQQNAEGH